MSQTFKQQNKSSGPPNQRPTRGTSNYPQRQPTPSVQIYTNSQEQEYVRTHPQQYLNQQQVHALVSPSQAPGHDMNQQVGLPGQAVYQSNQMVQQRPNHGSAQQQPQMMTQQQAMGPQQAQNLQAYYSAAAAAQTGRNLPRFPHQVSLISSSMSQPNSQVQGNQLYMRANYPIQATAAAPYPFPMPYPNQYQQVPQQLWPLSIGNNQYYNQVMYHQYTMPTNNGARPMAMANYVNPTPPAPSIQKREKKLIEIRDPNTNESLDLDNLNAKKTDPTHEMNHENQTKALSAQALAFTQQVAQVAHHSNPEPIPKPPYEPPCPEQPTPYEPLCSEIMPEPEKEIEETSNHLPTETIGEPVDIPEFIPSVCPAPQGELELGSNLETVPATAPIEEDDTVANIDVPDISQDNTALHIEEPIVDEIVEPEILPQIPQEAEVPVKNEIDREKQKKKTPTKKSHQVQKNDAQEPTVSTIVPEVAAVEVTPVKSTNVILPVEDEKTEVPATPIIEAEEEEIEVEPPTVVMEEKTPEVVITPTQQESTPTKEEIEESLEAEKKVQEKNEANKAKEAIENNINYAENEEKGSEEAKPPLKYTYEDDQWSPLNPEGKKKYSRDFLLQIQYEKICLTKPDLPIKHLEILRNSPNPQKLEQSRLTISSLHGRDMTHDPFMPNYVKTNVARSQQNMGGRRQSSNSNRGEKTKRIIVQPSVPQTVELRTTENAWKPQSKITTTTSTTTTEGKVVDEQNNAKIYREVRSILNKLTPEKFGSLVNKLLLLPINTEEVLNGVIGLVFEKAVDEPKFSNTYANMCKQLALYKVKIEGSENQTVNFRKLLLTKCQREFEKVDKEDLQFAEMMKEVEGEKDEKIVKQKREEINELKVKARRRSLGNIRFIGELYKLNMLTAPIMHDCLKKLLSHKDEDSLECFCQLIHTIGSALAKETESKEYLKHCSMESYFRELKEIIENGKVCSRIRFLLIDTVEFKENDYISKRISTPAQNNPTTIASIHKEAEREAYQAQQEANQNSQKRMDDRKNKNRNYPNTTTEDGWSSVSGGSRSKNRDYIAVDPSKKLTKLVADSEMKFRPSENTTASWGRGSSGGSKASSEGEKSAVCQNRFAALNQIDSDHRRGGQRSAASSRESSRNGTRQLPPSGIRKSLSQTTASHEKEDAISAVKNIVKTQSQRSSPDRPESRSSSKKKPELGLNGKVLDIDEIEKKCKGLFDEYFNGEDINEAVLCICELGHPETISPVLICGLTHALDKSSKDRKLVGKLCLELLNRKIISIADFKKSLKEILVLAEDFQIDIPKVWEYLGEMLAPVYLGADVSAKFLKETLSDMVGSSIAKKTIVGLLQMAAEREDEQAVKAKWSEAGLQWSDFLSENDDVKEFITTNKLEFMDKPPALQHRILDLLKINPSDDDIYNWIEKNLSPEELKQPSFIRALVTAVIEFAIDGSGPDSKLNLEKLKPCSSILCKYIDYNDTLELHALYAVQALVNRLEHPQGLLNSIFEVIYDKEVVSDEAFSQWELSIDPAEAQGRGVALKSSASFLSWLKKGQE